MNFLEELDQAIRTTVGVATGTVAAVLSIPEASLQALSSTIEGKDPSDAVNLIVQKYADFGVRLGEENAYTILNLLSTTSARNANKKLI